MEDRMPLDRRALTHTSKEPEAQVWAQIGTSSYDPPVPKSDDTQEEPTSPLENYHIPKLSQKNAEEDDGATSEVELHVDETAEPLQADNINDTAKEGSPEPTKETSENDEPFKLSLEEDEKVAEKKGESKSDEKEGKVSRRDRSRSRSRSPRRVFEEDLHTNSSDPKMIKSRIFVGHLNTSKASKSDVEKLFAPYGKIIGITLQNGYGFVQFDNEDSARKALREAHGTPFYGTKIVVDKTVAHKKLIGEFNESEKAAPSRRERAMLEELEFLRRKQNMYDRYSRLEELERHYYDRPSAYEGAPSRRHDPYYDRGYDNYYDRVPPAHGRDYDRYREVDRERMRERYPPSGMSYTYDRPRDDPYDYDRRPPPARDPYDYRRM